MDSTIQNQMLTFPARTLEKTTVLNWKAVMELKEDYTCIGEVNKLILTVVNNFGPTEVYDPKNQTTYNL